ncbi:putative hydrolase of the HAD superfamily [Nitrosospira sp. Nsp18]|uniref:HAD family hydrolase n=1 Tax=Nitrosospira sp. Nsp18 TaxID=1855334 RepID=UPI000882A8EC|nr:HAD family hydrolase [Nitrosospira sp. Nsp18]SDA19100.1 putative hydrolase of the HAD superfamily [Nitrosospira sp. Nsp18]
MTIKGILFDLYGTLIDIETNESMEEIYRAIAHYLTYQGVYLHRWEVRERYYQIMKQQKEARGEEYPEIDVEAIWNELLMQEGIRSAPIRGQVAKVISHIYRGISCNRLQLYPGVKQVLNELRMSYRLALISDAQSCFAQPEIRAVGLEGYFESTVISSHYGFRKPDSRLFQRTLGNMNLKPAEVIWVGNDMFRDIYGAKLLGIKNIFIDSNQGAKSYRDVAPDYRAQKFADVLKGVAMLRQANATATINPDT